MSTKYPFLQRRGNFFHFRIEIPRDLRCLIGKREFTRSLKTVARSRALPLALELGAVAKRLFDSLRDSTMSSNQLLDLLRVAQAKLNGDLRIEELKDEIDDIKAHHRRDVHVAKLEAKVESLQFALKHSETAAGRFLVEARPHGDTNSLPSASADKTKNAVAVPKVFAVIDGFLTAYPKDKRAAMFKKHLAALTLLRDFLGDRPVSELRQADINGFFAFVGRLPPRWADTCKRLRITNIELAKTDHPHKLGPKTFENNYQDPVRLFLKAATRDWQDQGFPSTLTTEGIEYTGDRKKGENKQRALTKLELERLFNGPELNALKIDARESHKWWLLLIGLFTGARVNEICQLNPQTDVLFERESGIPYLWITNETEGDDRIKKSTKTAGSKRKMPIHSKLVQLGLIEYLSRLKDTGAKLLFPSWDPTNGRASTQAEKWFRELLVTIDLRDDTLGFKVTGMHVFRHTLLALASNTVPTIDAGALTGHAGHKNIVQRGYEGELSLKNKQALLEAIDYKFTIDAVTLSSSKSVAA